MRILIHGINYFPELTGIGKYSGEMAKYFSDHGHEVRVITAPPYYPQWHVQEGYSAWNYRRELCDGIDVFRCPIWIPSRLTGITRVLHLASFVIFSFPIMMIQILWKPDLIIGIAPALLSSLSVLLVSRFTGSLSWLHIQDFELDAAYELGMLPARDQFYPIAKQLEIYLYRKFDRVSTISNRMLGRLYEKGLKEQDTDLFPNWVDVDEIIPLSGGNQLRTELGIENDQIVVLYSGNMGYKQGLEILIASAMLLNDVTEIIFIMCGDGMARHDLEEQSIGLSNVRLIPLQPAERLNLLLNAADIHVLPQKSNAADYVMPSKLLGILASGRPVVVTAQKDTELANLVSNFGCVVTPEEPEEIAKAINYLAQNPKIRNRLGSSGRDFVVTNWSKEEVLGNFLNQLVNHFNANK